jgi:transposase
MAYHDAYGCRGCSNGHTVCPVPGPGPRCARGANAAAALREHAAPDPPVGERAYEGDETRQLAVDLGSVPVMPPQHNRLAPWEYDRDMSKRRNERERLFRRLKGFRRIVSRFDKLDVMFVAFINFALIVDSLRSG